MGPVRIAALAIAAAASAPAQQQPVFRTDVRLVRLLATVRNLEGKLTGGLQKSDFTIHDNSVKQEIAIFERTTEQPLSIALLMDKSGSIAKDLKIALDSVKRFLQALFREGNRLDEISLFSFNWQVEQHIGFTRNIAEIEKRVQPIKAEAGTSLYDAIHFGARALATRAGRHVILVVTDGGDTTSALKYHDALEAAHRADAPIYSIVLMPITNDAGRNIGGENALTTLAQSTGGKVFTPTVGPELDRALSDILMDLRTQYLIAYYPKNIPPSKERFHRIRLELSRPDLRAVTRSGYYGDAEPDR